MRHFLTIQNNKQYAKSYIDEDKDFAKKGVGYESS